MVGAHPGSRQTPDFGTLEHDNRGELIVPLEHFAQPPAIPHPGPAIQVVAEPEVRAGASVTATYHAALDGIAFALCYMSWFLQLGIPAMLVINGVIAYSRIGADTSVIAVEVILVTAWITIGLGAVTRWLSRGLIERKRPHLVTVGVALAITGVVSAATAIHAERISSGIYLVTISIVILVSAFSLVKHAFRTTAPRGINEIS